MVFLKIKNMLIASSVLFLLSCGADDVNGVVNSVVPEVQSCNLEGYSACAEGDENDLTFLAACEGSNGVHAAKPCTTEDVVLKCEDAVLNL